MRIAMILIFFTLLSACGGNGSTPAPDPKAAASVALHVEGMTCGGCATSVKIVLEKLDGVVDADVSYPDKRAVVQYDPALVSPAQMISAIESKLEYKARVAGDEA